MYIKHSSSLGGFDILHSVCTAFSFAPHSHDEVVIAAYIDGKKHYTCHKNEGIALPGDVLLIGSDVVHSARSINNSNWQYLSIYLTLEQIACATGLSKLQISERCGSHYLLPSSQGGSVRGNELLHALEETEGSERELALSVFLVELMAMFLPNQISPTIDHNNISQVYDFIKEEALNDYSLSQLSELANMSKEHLCRTFKSKYGLTLFQLRASVRTEKARKYIQSGYELADAASASNFSDQSHMNRWFNRIYGVSPRQFQKF